MVYNEIIVTVTWSKVVARPESSDQTWRFASYLFWWSATEKMAGSDHLDQVTVKYIYVLRDYSEYIWSKLKTKKDNSLYNSFIPGLLSLFYISSDFQFIHFYFGSSYWLTIIIYYCTLQNIFINRRLRKMSEIL